MWCLVWCIRECVRIFYVHTLEIDTIRVCLATNDNQNIYTAMVVETNYSTHTHTHLIHCISF